MSAKNFRVTQIQARLCVLGAAALFSTGGAVVKGMTLDPWVLAALRSALAALCLACFLRGRILGGGRRQFVVALPFACTLLLFVLANAWTTAAHAIFLQSTAPLYVLLLGPIFLREHAQRRDVAILGLLGAGLAVLLLDRQDAQATAPFPWRGGVVAAVSGLTWAITIVGLRSMARGSGAVAATAGSTSSPVRAGAEDAALRAVVAGNVLAAVAGLGGLALLGGAWPTTAALGSAAGGLLWLGGVQIAGAYLLLERGLRQVPAAEAALYLLMEPILSPLWTFLWHGERLGLQAWIGAGLVLAGTLLRIAARR